MRPIGSFHVLTVVWPLYLRNAVVFVKQQKTQPMMREIKPCGVKLIISVCPDRDLLDAVMNSLGHFCEN